MDLVATLKLNADEYLRGIDSAVKGLDDFRKETNDLNKDWDALSSRMIGTGAALTAGLTAPILGVSAAAIKMGADFQQAELGFTKMLGSATEAKKFLDELKAFAAKTPFDFPELQQAAKRMMALGFESKQVIPMLTTVGDAAALLAGKAGQGGQMIDRITLALGQMQAKGKVSAQEMNQLAENGIKGWEALAKSIGVSVPEAMKLAEKGLISASQAIPVLLASMKNDFGGGMATIAGTITGQMSNLREKLDYILADLGKALLPLAIQILEMAKPAVEFIGNLVKAFAELPAPVQTFIVVVTGLAAAMGPVLLAVGGMIQGLTALAPLLVSHQAASAAAAAGTSLMAPAATGAAAAMGGLALAVAGAAAAIAGLIALFQTLSAFGKWRAAAMEAVQAGTALEKQTAVLEKTAASMGVSVDKTGKSIEKYALELNKAIRAHPDYKAKLEAAAKAQATIPPVVQSSTAALEKLVVQLRAAGKEAEAKQYEAMIASIKKMQGQTDATSASIKAHQEEMKRLNNAVTEAEIAYRKAYQQYQQGRIGIDELSAAQKRLQDAQDKVHPEKLAQRQAQAVEDMNKRLDDQVKWFTAKYAELEKLDRELEASTQKLATSYAKAYQEIQKSVQDMLKNPAKITVSLDERLPEEVNAAIQATKDIEEAYKTLGVESARVLQEKANKAERAYETIRDSGRASAQDILDAELAALKASIEAQRAAGEDITEAQKKRMEDLEKATKDSTEKQKSVWGDFTKQVSTIFSDFAKNVTERIWDAFSGKGNDELAKQRADLEANLAERTADWERYQQEVAAQLAEITRTHAEELAEELADLNAALADKRQDYYEYVASVNEALTEIRRSHTEELEEERQDLLAGLAEKLEAYEQYAADVAERIDEIKASHAEKLADELADLQDSLNDKSRAYGQYVQDINRKLSRIGQDLEEQIDDETRETNRGIEDRKRAYSRYEADILEKINNELAKGKDANQQQIADWRDSLNERSEDLQIYLARAAEDLEEFKSDAQKRAQQEEEDLKLSLQRRTEEHARYVAEVGARAGELTARHRTEEEAQIADLVQNLSRRRQEYDRYVTETHQRIDAATRKHAEQQAKEEADLMASFNRRTAEWERYQRDNAAKVEEATRKHAEQQAKEEADLAASLARRQQEYEQYLAEVAAGITDLESRHQGLAGTIGSLFTGVLSDLGQSITRFGVEYIEGVLWKKLKEVGTDILPELKDAFLSVFKKDGIIWNAVGDLIDFIGGLFKKTKDAIIGIGQEGLDQLAGWGIGGGSSGSGGGSGPSPAAGAPGAAGNAVGGGLGGAISAVAAAVTAISSVIGNFQMAGMNKSLDLIEHEVRYSQIHLGYILDRANRHLPKLDGMEEFNYSTIAPAWKDLLTHLDNYLPRFATAMETNLPTDLEAIHTSVENTKGTIESMRDLLAEKIGGLVSGFGEKLAPLVTGFKAAIDLSTSNLQSTLREIINSDATSRNAISSAFSMLGADVRNVQNAIYSTNMSGAMLTELGMIRGELTQIKSLSQTQINAKPSQLIVNVQAPVGTQSPQNFGYVAGSAIKSQGVFF